MGNISRWFTGKTANEECAEAMEDLLKSRGHKVRKIKDSKGRYGLLVK